MKAGTGGRCATGPSRVRGHTHHAQVLRGPRFHRSEELSEPPNSSCQVPVSTQNFIGFPCAGVNMRPSRGMLQCLLSAGKLLARDTANHSSAHAHPSGQLPKL